MRLSKLYVSASEHPCILAGGRFAAEQIEIIPVDGRGLLNRRSVAGTFGTS